MKYVKDVAGEVKEADFEHACGVGTVTRSYAMLMETTNRSAFQVFTSPKTKSQRKLRPILLRISRQ